MADTDNIWQSVLSSVSSKSSHQSKQVIILGDQGCGKTSLINTFREIKKKDRADLTEYALSYIYIDVTDEENDMIGRMGIWEMEGNEKYGELLKYALNKDTIENSLVVLTLDFSKPWEFMNSLQKWVSILKASVDSIEQAKYPMDDLREKNVHYFASYKEQATEDEAKSKSTVSASESIPNSLNDISLTKGALTKNLGIPIVVACLKYDMIPTIEKQFNLRESDFDAIQQHLRKFCLNYGASLFYVSSTQKKNAAQLVKYITNRLFGIGGNKEKPQIRGKDPLFIPAGWDSILKISQLTGTSPAGIHDQSNGSHENNYSQILFDTEDDRELYSRLMKAPQIHQDQSTLQEIRPIEDEELFKKFTDSEIYDRSTDDSQRSDQPQDSRVPIVDKLKPQATKPKTEKDKAEKEKPKEKSNEKMAQFFNDLKKRTSVNPNPKQE